MSDSEILALKRQVSSLLLRTRRVKRGLEKALDEFRKARQQRELREQYGQKKPHK